MKTTVDKQELIDWIKDLEDSAMLKTIKSLKDSTESGKDFWHDLPKETKMAINKAKAELDEGKGIPHDRIVAEVHDRFFK